MTARTLTRVIAAFERRCEMAREATGVRVVHVPVVNKDSRLLSGDDREKIGEAVYNSPSDRVLVTHGTFTMRDGQGY